MDTGGAVIELMAPGGFALVSPQTASAGIEVRELKMQDYALPADLMGHEYLAVQNDTTLPRDEWVRPDGKPVQQGPDFHSDHLPVSPVLLGRRVEGKPG